jgi:hypothetical protein
MSSSSMSQPALKLDLGRQFAVDDFPSRSRGCFFSRRSISVFLPLFSKQSQSKYTVSAQLGQSLAGSFFGSLFVGHFGSLLSLS